MSTGTAAGSAKETLYIIVFTDMFFGELSVVKNVRLIFENVECTEGPPINLSLPAFNGGFIEMEFALTTEVRKLFITFNIFFDSSVDNQTAARYAEDIINEFMRVYDYELELLWKSQGTHESKKVVHESFGYLPYTKLEVLKFMQFRPSSGLSTFIDSLIDKYVLPDNATTGISASYWLKRDGSKFHWDFWITGVESLKVPRHPHDYQITIDVNEWVNNDISKLKLTENRKIIISIETNKTLNLPEGRTTYTTTIESIEPEGYVTSNSSYFPNNIEIIYQSQNSLNNIVIKIHLNSSTETEPFQLPAPLIYFITFLIAFSVVYLLLWVFFPKKGGILRKKLREEKIEEFEMRCYLSLFVDLLNPTDDAQVLGSIFVIHLTKLFV